MHRVGPTNVGRRSPSGVGAAPELLRRNEVPHRWVDLDRDPLVPLLETESLSAGRLPLVLFPDGTRLEGVFYEPRAAKRCATFASPSNFSPPCVQGRRLRATSPWTPFAGWQ
jgi:hypothetical protein